MIKPWETPRSLFGIPQPQSEDKVPIDKPYAYHKPSDHGLFKLTQLREHFSESARLIKELCGNNREASVALTKNEETAMWAIKSVVLNDPHSEVGEDPEQ